MSWAKGQEKQLFCFSSPKKDLIQKQSVIVGGILYSIRRRYWQKQISLHLFACELRRGDSNGWRTHMDPNSHNRGRCTEEGKADKIVPPAHLVSGSSFGTKNCFYDLIKGDFFCCLLLTIAAHAQSMWVFQTHGNTWIPVRNRLILTFSIKVIIVSRG